MSFIRRADQPIYNMSDVLQALKYSVGINPYDPTALGRYDYNQDGTINHSDVIGITNYNEQYAIDKLKRDAGIQPEPPIPTPMTMRRPTFQPRPAPPLPGSGDIVPLGGDNSMSIGNPGYRSRPSMPDVANSGIGGAFAKSLRSNADRFNGRGYATRITPEQMKQREEMLLDQMRNAPPGITDSGPNSLNAKLGRTYSRGFNSAGVGYTGGGGPSLEENIIDPNSIIRGRTSRNLAPGTGGSGIPPIDRSQIGMPEPAVQPPGFGGRGIPPIDRREIGVTDPEIDRSRYSDFPPQDLPPGYRGLFGGRGGGVQPAVMPRNPILGEISGGPAINPFDGDPRRNRQTQADPRYNPPQDQRRTPTQQMNPLQMLQQRLMQQRAMQQRMNPMMGMGLGGFNRNGMGMNGFGFQPPQMRQPMGRFGGMGGGFPGQMFGMPQNRFGGIGFGGFGGGFPGMMFGGGGGYNPYQQRPQFGGGFGGGFQQQFVQPRQQGNMGYGFGQQTFNQFQQPQQQNQLRFGAIGY